MTTKEIPYGRYTEEQLLRNRSTILKNLKDVESNCKRKLGNVRKIRDKFAALELKKEKTSGVIYDITRRERDKVLRATFGITLEDYDNKLEEQNNSCAICGRKHRLETQRSLAVDHCHTTGLVRGLLCMNCNTAIGHFRDDKTLLQKAIDYLSTHHPEESDGKA